MVINYYLTEFVYDYRNNALEVLIFKGKKVLSINRIQVQSPDFYRVFRKRYEK